MKAGEAIGAVVARAATPGGHRGAAAYTQKALVPVYRVLAHLRANRPVQTKAQEPAAVKVGDLFEPRALFDGEPEQRRPMDRPLSVEPGSPPFDLAAALQPEEPRHVHTACYPGRESGGGGVVAAVR